MRGEFPLLWSFTDSGSPDSEAIKDDTIEPPSEAAQRARAEARANADAESKSKANGVAAGTSPEESEAEAGETTIDQDDSWMNDPVGVPGTDGKARKRKGKKK